MVNNVFVILCFLLTQSIISHSITALFPYSSSLLSVIDGNINLFLDVPYKFRIYGKDLNDNTLNNIRLTTNQDLTEDECLKLDLTYIVSEEYEEFVVKLTFIESILGISSGKVYLCACYLQSIENSKIICDPPSKNPVHFVVQRKPFSFPLFVSIIFVCLLLCCSALFSGLNIGLMSLNQRELSMIVATGKPREKSFAKNILPLRRLGNILLCSILLCNTGVNSTMTILIDGISSGSIAIVLSTVLIMMFGEIIPQAICTRFALIIGSYTRFIMWVFVVLSFPISYPLGKLLNCILGDETLGDFGRLQLLEMIKMEGVGEQLGRDEIGIISGALNYKQIKVDEIMVPLKNCFLLEENSVLDFETISSIVQSGFSRIPIYSSNIINIVGILHLKDLAFVDPDDRVPLISVINFYKRQVVKVFSDITLDELFIKFKMGVSHMAIVMRIEYPEDSDPVHLAVGVITLEDIIEVILQANITDETDAQVTKARTESGHPGEPYKKLVPFFHQEAAKIQELSPNMLFTVCQFLSSMLPEFSENLISKNQLKSFVSRSDVVTRYTGTTKEPIYIYKKGEMTDYFTIILEGRLNVTVGSEDIYTQQGPFTYLGLSCLRSSDSAGGRKVRNINFIPDFSAHTTDILLCLRIKSTLYFKMISTVDTNESHNENEQVSTKSDNITTGS